MRLHGGNLSEVLNLLTETLVYSLQVCVCVCVLVGGQKGMILPYKTLSAHKNLSRLTSSVFTKSLVVYSTVSVEGLGLHSSLTAFAAKLISLPIS